MDLLICGASGRAAAFSAARAGVRPTVVDLFADSDLARVGPAHRIPAHLYPAGLVELACSLPPSAWLYTGALENHPEVVDAISRRHRLFGNAGAVLRAVRDPFNVAEVLRLAGLPCPEVRSSPGGLARDGRWLVKPLASGGGLGIAPLVDDAVPTGAYVQERVVGQSFSAVYVAHRAACRLAGVTRQLIGRPGAPFAYLGSVGPWPLEPDVCNSLDRLGVLVAEAFGLAGLFGIDFILRDGEPWPVEINPRYTASVEVLELATGVSVLSEHLTPPVRPLCKGGSKDGVVGKAVVYASADCKFPERPRGRLGIADVPAAGTPIRAGEPVLTVFASGRTTDECLARLERRRRLWEVRLRAS